ncbi:MAG TPA: sodium-dependent transporter [Candidatus Fimivivens faecavium]|nr:sodium-dependent transporter [Candidatus Fimivivens faecavium]
MSNHSKQEGRGQWASHFGFLMAAVGSAVGLGNLWAFPYKLGKNGGFAFLLIYLVLVFVVGSVVMVTELSLGRMTKRGPIGAYSALDKRFTFNGAISVFASFIILSFYSVLGGWSLKYFLTYVLEMFGNGFHGLSGADFFNSFVADPVQAVLYHALFMAITGVIVLGGISGGIERCSKVMMPALFVMMLAVIVRSVTLPGAADGLAFIFKPDFTVFQGSGGLAVFAAALSQMFFSLSLGMGITICYGSYLPPSSNILRSAVIIPLCDTLVAVMAAVAIMPAVFAFGLDPKQGPSLLYVVLREVFAAMPGGAFFGALFYLLVFFAALTSSIALLEVTASYLVDERKIPRKKSVFWAVAGVFATGLPSALGFGVLGDVTLPTFSGEMLGILDWVDYVGEYALMTIGVLIMCIFVGYVLGPKRVIAEIERDGTVFRLKGVWSFMIRTVTPALVLLTFLTATGLLKL